MIVAGTSPLIWIDLGENEPGMILQHLERLTGKGGYSYTVGKWKDYRHNGKPVKSPVDIDSLPPVSIV